jgi:hypothetical protein
LIYRAAFGPALRRIIIPEFGGFRLDTCRTRAYFVGTGEPSADELASELDWMYSAVEKLVCIDFGVRPKRGQRITVVIVGNPPTPLVVARRLQLEKRYDISPKPTPNYFAYERTAFVPHWPSAWLFRYDSIFSLCCALCHLYLRCVYWREWAFRGYSQHLIRRAYGGDEIEGQVLARIVRATANGVGFTLPELFRWQLRRDDCGERPFDAECLGFVAYLNSQRALRPAAWKVLRTAMTKGHAGAQRISVQLEKAFECDVGQIEQSYRRWLNGLPDAGKGESGTM